MTPLPPRRERHRKKEDIIETKDGETRKEKEGEGRRKKKKNRRKQQDTEKIAGAEGKKKDEGRK